MGRSGSTTPALVPLVAGDAVLGAVEPGAVVVLAADLGVEALELAVLDDQQHAARAGLDLVHRVGVLRAVQPPAVQSSTAAACSRMQVRVSTPSFSSPQAVAAVANSNHAEKLCMPRGPTAASSTLPLTISR